MLPLVIHEFVKDPDKRWRYIRLASVGTPLVWEARWQYRISGRGTTAASGVRGGY
jgi:hypothetical protein